MRQTVIRLIAPKGGCFCYNILKEVCLIWDLRFRKELVCKKTV